MPTGLLTRPTDIPRWASVSPGTVRLAPSSGQKDTGWLNGQRPPYNVMNWLQGVIYDWQQWLEDAVDELDAEKLERDGGNAVIGNILPDTSTGRTLGDATHRFDHFLRHVNISGQIDGHVVPASDQDRDLGTTANSYRTAMIKNLDMSQTAQGDVIMGGNEFRPSVNGAHLGASAGNRWDCFFDDVDISGDITGDLRPATATGQRLGDDSPSRRWDAFCRNVAVSGTLDVTGVTTLGVLNASSPEFGDATINTEITFDDNGNDVAANQINGGLFAKAWGVVTTDGSGGVVFSQSQNTASISVDATKITVTLDNAMTPSTLWAPIASIRGSALPYIISCKPTSSTVFEIRMFKSFSSGDVEDLTALGVTISFVVFGRQ